MVSPAILKRLAHLEVTSRTALRIALFYVVAAVFWIVFSDMVLEALLPDHVVGRIQTAKGICFVMVTAALLFGLIRRSLRREIALRDSRSESQHRWRELVDNTKDAVIILDGRRIIFANSAAAALVGVDDSSVPIGRDIDSFLIVDDVVSVERGIGKVARGLEIPSHPFRIRRVDGSERTIEAHSMSIRLYDHPVVLSILVDITEQLQQREMLIRAKEEAEQLAKMKTSILTNMSHEIRTPLTGIIGIAEVLIDELQGETHELAKLLQDSGWRLTRTLDSILTHAQLQSSNMNLQPRPLELGEAVLKVVHTLAPLAAQKHIQLDFTRDAQVILTEVDPSALDRVLLNVIENAVKFTHEGDVAVSVDVDEDYALIDVRDTGIGISEEFLPHIFEEYWQESQGMGRDYEGSGLGLAIAKRFVDLMGGDIIVESKKGIGTTARVALPLTKEIQSCVARQ